MRELADSSRIRRFMEAIGRAANRPVRVYFTGGASAVLDGWRASTIDADLILQPEDDQILREFPGLKESLRLNIELASPADFVPELPGWRDRSAFIEQIGFASFHHYDWYAQALAKIERGHAQDQSDVEEMLRRGYVDPDELMRHFERIESQLYRYPAIDPSSFRRAVERRCGR